LSVAISVSRIASGPSHAWGNLGAYHRFPRAKPV
jgi:hypothetical protein